MSIKFPAQIASAVMWLLIAGGGVAIFIDSWHRIDARYHSEGVVTEVFMLIIMGGIPAIAFAGVVSIAFRFLFGPTAIASPPKADASKKQTDTPSGKHDFID